jgi:hypothetical protein
LDKKDCKQAVLPLSKGFLPSLLQQILFSPTVMQVSAAMTASGLCYQAMVFFVATFEHKKSQKPLRLLLVLSSLLTTSHSKRKGYA